MMRKQASIVVIVFRNIEQIYMLKEFVDIIIDNDIT